MNKTAAALDETAARTGAAPPETEITLGVLGAVEQNSAVTQRSMARELGIALGLANAYLKRCMRKGWIKVRQIPPNRYLYYLTPKGFAEKSRLSAEYLASSFTFFRRARGQVEDALGTCRRNGWRRVALLGRSELAEIAALCNSDYGLELCVIAGDGAAPPRALGLPAHATLAEAGPLDAVIVTDLTGPQRAFDGLKGLMPDERIITPRMLRIARG